MTIYERAAAALTNGGHACTEEHVRAMTWRAMWGLIGANCARAVTGGRVLGASKAVSVHDVMHASCGMCVESVGPCPHKDRT